MALFSETEIIKGCLDNDRTHQQYLYRQYFSLFLKICARYARNTEDAEQLLNDSFLRIFNNIGSFKKAGSFEGWMKRIVINTCLDYLKSKQLKNAMQISYTADSNEKMDVSINTEAIQEMSFKELVNLIQTLPAMSKTVFNLYVFDGYAHKEIAVLLNISESTSSWHLHNARSLLQQKLKSEDTIKTFYESKRV